MCIILIVLAFRGISFLLNKSLKFIYTILSLEWIAVQIHLITLGLSDAVTQKRSSHVHKRCYLNCLMLIQSMKNKERKADGQLKQIQDCTFFHRHGIIAPQSKLKFQSITVSQSP